MFFFIEFRSLLFYSLRSEAGEYDTVFFGKGGCWGEGGYPKTFWALKIGKYPGRGTIRGMESTLYSAELIRSI